MTCKKMNLEKTGLCLGDPGNQNKGFFKITAN